jgi:hypothetical protein
MDWLGQQRRNATVSFAVSALASGDTGYHLFGATEVV